MTILFESIKMPTPSIARRFIYDEKSYLNNYKADQPGITSFKYSLFPLQGYDVSFNMKKSLEAVQPLIGKKTAEITLPDLNSYSLDNDKVIVESIKVKNSELVELNLFNSSDHVQTGRLIEGHCKELYEIGQEKNFSGKFNFSKHEMKRIHCKL